MCCSWNSPNWALMSESPNLQWIWVSYICFIPQKASSPTLLSHERSNQSHRPWCPNKHQLLPPRWLPQRRHPMDRCPPATSRSHRSFIAYNFRARASHLHPFTSIYIIYPQKKNIEPNYLSAHCTLVLYVYLTPPHPLGPRSRRPSAPVPRGSYRPLQSRHSARRARDVPRGLE